MRYKLINYYPPYKKKDIGKIVWFGPNNLLGPENYPEFWELVVEKDYEILEVKGKYGAVSSYIEILDSDLKDKTIFKIKRLSDGEIFTIGDKLNNSYISNILLQQDIIWLMCQGNSINSKLDDAVKIKQPLFTTEDGVDIFEGDIYYKVVNNIFQLVIMENASKGESLKSKVFSTKEKAEEYILMNKPCLSLNEVIFTIETHRSKLGGLRELKEIVNTKING